MSATGITHIAHVLHRFATGGMENIVVQLINELPHAKFKHTVIAITDSDPEFARRIVRPDVEIIELRKPPGQPFLLYPKVFLLLRRLAPHVFHSCNLAALEFAPVALFAGVKRRVHAEHGWDVSDPDGSNLLYRYYRKVYKYSVNHFVAVSTQLNEYLRDSIKVPPDKISLIPNGVDTDKFRPALACDTPPAGYPFRPVQHWVIGTVGRLAPIKNQTLLAEAFVRLVNLCPPGGDRLRLAVVGEGVLSDGIATILSEANLIDRLWMPGRRDDIAEILRSLDCFVLPSLAEGTSCTLQEAMATGLPIVATAVGGTPDLLAFGRFGWLVPSKDSVAMAETLARVFLGKEIVAEASREARAEIQERYSMKLAVSAYMGLFTNH